MNLLLLLVVALPLFSFFLTLLWQNRKEKPIAWIVRLTKVLNMGMALFLAGYWWANGRQPLGYEALTLYHTDHFVFAVQFYYDEVTLVFSIVGAVLFFLVATFSKYYMHRDEGYKRFFNIILLFAAGYNLIIFSGNFESLFIGWEIKGLCSFLLIAFYRKRYLPVKNAFKTVSYYRISDVSMMLAMWMLHHLMQRNISFPALAEAKETALLTGQSGMAVFITAMFILPAMIKSAQFPFTSWLPRAMEGPTNSSAIFYGSLSVHIGVFVLLRTHPFWEDLVWAKALIITAGALTAIIATLIARVQPTVKTQIAYASAAQIGLMFIEIALGFHWLVLIHFAGNAFLRTYQLLVSPSVLNYLVHHQYFHYKAPGENRLSAAHASLFMLGVKEWNMDSFMFRWVWSPFKWIGRQFRFLQASVFTWISGALAVAFVMAGMLGVKTGDRVLVQYMPLVLLALALVVILFAFSSRGSAIRAWIYLPIGHFLILAALLYNGDAIRPVEVFFYISGFLAAALLGYGCLRYVKAIDQDISLNYFHGYVYEAENAGLLFLIAALGMLGFPVTAAFVGIDVLFTYVHHNQWPQIILLALCFIFIELAAFRILLRIFLGPHKKLDHPVAFRSS